MNKKQFIYGLIIMMVVVIGLILWYRKYLPSQAETMQASTPIVSVDKNLLNGSTSKNLLSREINGSVPVKVDSSEIGRDDPFANY